MSKRDDVVLQLLAAHNALSAALAMLAKPDIELPSGVERPCTHPESRRLRHMGGHWTCKDCGYHE